ncbi:MAG: ABC transporter substrate-binding protein [Chthoniobacteraceae bacterium]
MLTVVAGLLLMVWLVAGCTRRDEGAILFSFWGSAEQQKVEKKIVAEFEKENPDVKVSILPIGQRYSTKIQSMIVGDIAPDVLMVDMQHYDEWASRGVFLDITDAVNELGSADFMPVAVKAYRRDGRYFAAPVNAHGLVLYCNLDALKAAGIPFSPRGWTWDQILEMAPGLTGRGKAGGADYCVLLPRADLMMASFGARLFDDPARPTRAVVESEEARAALRIYKTLKDKGWGVAPDVADEQGMYQLFRDGRVAFYFSGRWFTPELAGKTKFAWDVAPVPSGPAGSVTFHGGTGIGVWSKTRHRAEALRFLKFYAGRKGADIAMRGGRNVPVYRTMAYGPAFLGLRPPASMITFSKTMEEGASTLPIYAPGYAEVVGIVRRHMDGLTYGDASPEEVLAGLQKDVDRWLVARRKAAGGK